jgi:3-keto-L-gulonate-6-phosphate decarboxylase
MNKSEIEKRKAETKAARSKVADAITSSHAIENTIIESNKLIAEFMGKTVYPVIGDKDYKKWKGQFCDYEIFQLKYHSSWDSLMPVYKKLKGDYKHISMLWRDVENALLDADVFKTFEAIVAYIKWFSSSIKR